MRSRHVAPAMALAVAVAGSMGLAQTSEPRGQIVAVKPVVFPSYESYSGISRYAPTPEDYVGAIRDAAFVMERITYRSDDLEVHAYLYRPSTPPAGLALPVVVF